MTYGEELMSQIWPLALFLIMVAGLIGLMLTLPALLGGRRVSRAVNEPYECGIVPAGSGESELTYQTIPQPQDDGEIIPEYVTHPIDS